MFALYLLFMTYIVPYALNEPQALHGRHGCGWMEWGVRGGAGRTGDIVEPTRAD